MTRVVVKPELLLWAQERCGIDRDALVSKFRKLPEWESGEIQPTLKQLENFARKVRVPFGYLFLSHPPKETLPIDDFRTLGGESIERPSPELLDVVHACQERQDWYRDFARGEGLPEVDFVGSVTVGMASEKAAAEMRRILDFSLEARRECGTWEEVLQLFVRRMEERGVLVMRSGIVGSDTSRTLDVGEFRGFALSDGLAPLIFINSRDARAAQMFTLAHEFAHLWLGASGVSNAGAKSVSGLRTEETWCNAAAAELLVPLSDLRKESRQDEPVADALRRLRSVFKVSNMVLLRRLLDAGRISRTEFESAWQEEKERFEGRSASGGGDFYNTTFTRLGHRFIRALVADAREGRTLYRDAFRMLGVSGIGVFNNLGEKARGEA